LRVSSLPARTPTFFLVPLKLVLILLHIRLALAPRKLKLFLRIEKSTPAFVRTPIKEPYHGLWSHSQPPKQASKQAKEGQNRKRTDAFHLQPLQILLDLLVGRLQKGVPFRPEPPALVLRVADEGEGADRDAVGLERFAQEGLRRREGDVFDLAAARADGRRGIDEGPERSVFRAEARGGGGGEEEGRKEERGKEGDGRGRLWGAGVFSRRDELVVEDERKHGECCVGNESVLGSWCWKKEQFGSSMSAMKRRRANASESKVA
jgi:hypothetical protein